MFNSCVYDRIKRRTEHHCPVQAVGKDTPRLRSELLSGCFQTLLELINATAGINELLLTRKERMAFGANFNTDAVLNGAGHEFLAASALYSDFLVFGMDSCFHC